VHSNTGSLRSKLFLRQLAHQGDAGGTLGTRIVGKRFGPHRDGMITRVERDHAIVAIQMLVDRSRVGLAVDVRRLNAADFMLLLVTNDERFLSGRPQRDLHVKRFPELLTRVGKARSPPCIPLLQQSDGLQRSDIDLSLSGQGADLLL